MTEELERAVLGAILNGARIPPEITPEMFTGKNRIIFLAANEEDGGDLRLLANRLREKGLLEQIGPAYLASLTTGVFPSNIDAYTRNLTSAYTKNRLETALRLAYEDIGKRTPEEIYAELQRKFEEVPVYGRKVFRRITEVELTAPQLLVENLPIEIDSFACVAGDPSSGKSFLAFELAACIASGVSFYGRRIITPGPVAIFAAEGRGGIRRRFRAWSIARGEPEPKNVFINELPLSLIDENSVNTFAAGLAGFIKEYGQPSLLIYDTWQRNLCADDSDPRDAAEGVRAVDVLRKAAGGCATLIIHHSGHKSKERGRGWSGLHASLDVAFMTERDSEGILRVKCTKAKDFSEAKPMAFRFCDVELDIADAEGNPIHSAVLTEIDYTPPAGSAEQKTLGKNQKIALEVLKRLLAAADDGRVLAEVWKKECYSAGIDRRRFPEVMKALSDSGAINSSGYFVSCPSDVRAGCPVRPLLYNGPDISDIVRSPDSDDSDSFGHSDKEGRE